MDIRPARTTDWRLLKAVRLNALKDSPNAFAVTYQSASNLSDEQWQALATATAHRRFWLAVEDDEAVGLVGSLISAADRYTLIAMWVEPQRRGSDVAARLVESVTRDAIQKQHKRVYLEVSPDNHRAVGFYQKQGFAFIDEWEPLDSDPTILMQTMICNSVG
ncbi:GNAT family N-acetyltransferase [Ectopseudomonas mendocina]|uniref:GNAT family N-acetyltransferase n=1 Tax=Ectopseudomonas mendocina TaxID=300 RepID=A0ABZ2RHT3_ECTME